MKQVVLMVTLMMVLGVSFYLREDPFVDGRFRVYDETWKPQGYIIRDRISPDRYHIYDKDWQREGYLKRDWDKRDLQGYDEK